MLNYSWCIFQGAEVRIQMSPTRLLTWVTLVKCSVQLPPPVHHHDYIVVLHQSDFSIKRLHSLGWKSVKIAQLSLLLGTYWGWSPGAVLSNWLGMTWMLNSWNMTFRHSKMGWKWWKRTFSRGRWQDLWTLRFTSCLSCCGPGYLFLCPHMRVHLLPLSASSPLLLAFC